MPARNFTDEEEAAMAARYLSGVSARQIAREHGLSHHISITAALRRQGIEQRSAPDRNRLYVLDAHVFDVVDTEEKAYWWGFVYADGCINRRSLIVALAEIDEPQLAKLNIFLRSDAPIKKRPNGEHESVWLSVTDGHLANRLRELGVVPRRPSFARVVANLPSSLARHWIRGYFDGDGSVSAMHNSQLAVKIVGQKELVEWIRQQLHENVGSPATGCIYKHTKSEIYYVNYNGRKRCLGIADYLYNDATVWMDRKRERFDAKRQRPTYSGQKLTPEKVREIRGLYAGGGWTHEELGTMYGVSASAIRLIVKRLTWEDVD